MEIWRTSENRRLKFYHFRGLAAGILLHLLQATIRIVQQILDVLGVLFLQLHFLIFKIAERFVKLKRRNDLFLFSFKRKFEKKLRETEERKKLQNALLLQREF